MRDGQTPHDDIGRACIASRCKKMYLVNVVIGRGSDLSGAV